MVLICISLTGNEGLPRWHSGEESACQCKRHKRCRFDPWVGKIAWRRKWQPTPVLLPGKSQGQRSLAATVQGVAQSRTRQRTHTHTHRPWCWTSFHGLICIHFCVCVKCLLSSFAHLKSWVVYFLTVENSNINIFWIQVFCQICDLQTLSLNW